MRCESCSKLQSPALKCRGCEAEIRDLVSDTAGMRFHDLRHSFISHMVERESRSG